MEKLKPYFQPKSLTWWSGVAMILTGGALMGGLDHPAFGHVSYLLSLMAGNASNVVPAQLVFTGLMAIGIRAKLEKM